MRRAAWTMLTAAMISLAAASCSDPSKPDEPRSPQTSPTASTTAPVTPAWESRYSSEELEVYRTALSRWEAYNRAIQPHNAAGRATSAAKKVYQDFVIPWQVYFQRLEGNEAAGVRIARPATVLDSKATRIVLDPNGSSVTIEECVDASDIKATRNGEPVISPFDQPQLSTVVMSEVDGRWLVSDTPGATEDRPCDAQG